ncbi:MAG TPA: H-NS histone family protein [Burkholderiaceae bacterium]|jgi:DNA-binding protein H-NS|nr:H-NS histone family protein [Burkholderiaceae bacterium]
MATSQDLRQQAQKLLAEAEVLRKQELADAIANIKSQMADLGITIADLGGRTSGLRASRSASAKADKVVKYRSPNGLTWGGGRGRKPQWVVDALAAGKNIEDFAV